MVLYDGYCYSTAADVANVIAAKPREYSANYISWNTIKIPSTGQTVSMQLNKIDYLGAAQPSVQTTQVLPSCSQLGPYPVSTTLFDTPDALSLSWLVVAVWASAWAFKTLRRTL